MCTTVVAPDGRWLHSVRELREAGIPVDADLMDADTADDDCMCGVDVESALRRAGIPFDTPDGGAFFDVLELPSEP